MSAFFVVVSVLVLYGALVAATTLATQPARRRLVILAETMAAEPGRSSAERAEIDWLGWSSMSRQVGWTLPAQAALVMFLIAAGAPRKVSRAQARLEADPRFTTLAGLYMVSVMGCNPVAALLSMPFIVACVVISALRGDSRLILAAETPVIRASVAMQPAG